LHRVLGQGRYRAGGLVLAPEQLLQAEEEALARGERPTTVLDIGLWARDYQEVDIFNWQQEVADMLSVPDVERELGVAGGGVRREVERLRPDWVLRGGERKCACFRRNRLEEIRVAIGAPKLEDHTLRERFFQFLADTDMRMSYKPVMLLALLEAIDAE